MYVGMQIDRQICRVVRTMNKQEIEVFSSPTSPKGDINRQIDRKIYRQIDRKLEIYIDRQMLESYIQINRQIIIYTDRLIDR